MPSSENWPFQRLMVDHLFEGKSRIWWTLRDDFNDPQPHGFQLQAGYTGNLNALDWVNVGEQAVNAYYLDDDSRREETGKRLLTHYRVVLITSRGKYVSGPQGIYGTMNIKDWLFSREIIRKEALRNELVSKPGYLLRRMRYGITSRKNTDSLTDEITDSSYPASWGTAFQVGYHPPVNVMADFQQLSVTETRGGADISRNNARPDDSMIRILAFPDIAMEDVWVDATTDERWLIGEDISVGSAWRGVPLIYNVKISLIPFSDVIYKIPVTNLSFDPTDQSHFQPTVGCGSVRVDHDYPTNSNLVYQTGDCCGIDGATVLAYTLADWNGSNRVPSAAVASSQTTTNGTWAWAMQLNPGDYVLVFEKTGQYGPDAVQLHVDAPAQPEPPQSSSVSIQESVNYVDAFGSF